MRPKADILVEVSWEVCNKVGGIYTVLTSKVEQIMNQYHDDYFVIGPYFRQRIAGEFEEMPLDIDPVLDALKTQGIIVHAGRWLTKGKPKALLIEVDPLRGTINAVKKDLWESFKIDSLNAPSDYDEPVVWSYAAGKLIEALQKHYSKTFVAQFHEWLSGAGLLYLKKYTSIGTVFTTHATVLGRTLSSAHVDLFSPLDNGKNRLELLDMQEMAYTHHVESKHLLEKAAAHHSTVFTTVSEITGIEASFILKRKPDVYLLNGLDMEKFPTFEDASIQHTENRRMLREFALAYFFPYYTFDIRESLFFFLAGRYEFRDKGIDIYLKSLAQLNEQMKKENSQKTVIAFIWVPAGINGVHPVLLENKIMFKSIKDLVNRNADRTRINTMYTLLERKNLNAENIFGNEFLDDAQKKLAKLRKPGMPPLSTHEIQDSNDAIIGTCKSVGLLNRAEDRVKIVFYPTYLNGADGLLDMTYYEAMSGGHLGIFPSFYEPWGYTPLEAAALGVSSVTTDLAGFGRFILQQEQKKHPGIFVLKRMNRNDDKIIKDLAEFMHAFTSYSKTERVQNKIQAKKLAALADWSKFITYYIEAHNKAVA